MNRTTLANRRRQAYFSTLHSSDPDYEEPYTSILEDLGTVVVQCELVIRNLPSSFSLLVYDTEISEDEQSGYVDVEVTFKEFDITKVFNVTLIADQGQIGLAFGEDGVIIEMNKENLLLKLFLSEVVKTNVIPEEYQT